MGKQEWDGTTYGNSLMHRWLIAILRRIDIRIIYIFTYIFVIPPCLFRPGFKHIYRYFRKQWGCNPVKAFLMTYLNHCMFAQVVIDRFAMYAGRHFHVDIEGMEYFQELAARPEAFVQLSAHVGNYELAGYTLVSDKKRLNALVFFGEKQTVMNNRRIMFSDTNIRMIPIKGDMSHLFLIDQALENGEIMSMPADRIIGSQKIVKVKLLRSEVQLPLGPFSVPTMRSLDVLAVNVMKKSALTYQIYVTPLHYDKTASRREQIAQLSRAYADELERILKMYPTQWYNYFDFWRLS